MEAVRLGVLVCVLIVGARAAGAQPAPDPAPPPDPAPTPAPEPAPPPVTEPTTEAPVPTPPPPREPKPAPPPVERAQAEQLCAAQDPNCSWAETLGGLERLSLRRALSSRGYELDPVPWGKVIGKVRIYNEDVFSEGGPVLKFLNNFHVTTKESAIAGEIVVRAGEVWNQELIEESSRRLRDPLWSSVIVIVPVKSAEPGKVDVLIVTRDVWSLRLNTKYTIQQGTLTNLSTSLSENNFLGRRNVLAAAVLMDQGAIAVGPLFYDENVLGKHVSLRVNVAEILTRDDLFDRSKLHSEGSSSSISLKKPLWSLASQWGTGMSFSHRFAIDRQFRGTALDTYDDPQTAGDDMLPRLWSIRAWSANAYVEHQWGDKLKQRIELGHSVDSQHPEPLASFPGDAAQRAAFIRDVLPRSELTSVPYVAYSLYTPKYRTRRNVQTYDLAEDVRIGPSLDASFGVGLKILGSDNNFERGGVSGSWTVPWARDGTITVASGVSLRLQGGALIDNTASASTRVVTPLFRYFRVVGASTLATRWNDTQNRFFRLGGDPGLRGFLVNELPRAGESQRAVRAFVTQIEARSISKTVWILPVGAVLFWDSGSVAETLGELRLHNSVGVGFRMLVPQTSRELFRFDFPIPLDGPDRYHLKVIASFDQAF
jgi:hypothetical protein